MIGTSLGHYEIIRKVGSGGMGDVYAARDTTLDREVALKVLPRDVADNEERNKRFQREAKAAAALSHPGIVTLYSVEEADGQVFITMELVEGKSLAEVIPEKGFDLQRFLELAIQLTDAVATAHEQGVTHRDLKPQNVIVTPDGAAKVLDFGLAKFHESSQSPATTHMATATATTGEGRILGTPAYMSPEQAEGKDVDHRTDIFSLGIVLYEMATGRRPFEGDSAMSIISSVLKDTPSSVAELRSELPVRLARIVNRCLVKNPRRRYQSARDVTSDLDDLREELREVGSASRLDLGAGAVPARRGFPVWLLAALVVVAVAVGAIGYFAGSRSPVASPKEEPKSEADRPPFVKRFQRVTTEYGSEVGSQISPDGKWFVYAAGTEHADIFRQRVGGMKRTNLTEGSGTDNWQPSISADGEQIAFRSERDGGGIFIMGATGESVRRVSDFGHHPAWSPDGKRLLVGTEAIDHPGSRGRNSEAWIIEVDSGEKHQLESVHDAPQGTWSPNGRFAAFCGTFGPEKSRKRGLYTAPLAGGDPTLLVDFKKTLLWTPFWSPDGRHIYYSDTASGVMNIWRVSVDPETGAKRGDPEQVTAGVAMSACYPSVSRDGKHLLFSVSSMSGNIAKLEIDPVEEVVKGAPVMLTRGANGYSAASVSPDGEWLAFGSSQVRPDTEENIYLSRTDGSELRALTLDTKAFSRLPMWTADGEKIVFYSRRSNEYELWSVKPDGSAPQQITDTPGEDMLFVIPAKQGTMAVAKNMKRGIFLFDLAVPFTEQTVQPLPGLPDLDFWPADWSPDGSLIVGGMAQGGLYIYSLKTKNYKKIHDVGFSADFLSDGKRLIVTEGSEFKLIDIHGGKPKLLSKLEGATIFGNMSVSRDDRWLYFSMLSEDGDVWLAELE